jgi:hypothetical protein
MDSLKFGRKPYTRDPRVRKYGELLRGDVPAIPDEIDWLSNLPLDVGIYGNDQYGDCFWAGMYHQASLWLKQVSQLDVTETTDNVLQAYGEATGFNIADPSTDQGTDPNQGLTYCMNTGLPVGALGGRRKLDGFFECSIEHILPVMWECGGVGLGINVYANNMPDDGPPADIWDYVPGSPLKGLHWVVGGKWSKKDGLLYIETWGQSRRWALTENFVQNAVECSYGLVSGEWVNGFTGKTPLGLSKQDWDGVMQPLKIAA